VLRTITEPIQRDLEIFEKQFLESLETDVELLNKIVRYMAAHKGKRLRPTLTFLTSHLVGGPTPRTFWAALIVELIHTATLIHDDVVDESEIRRGAASINAIWDNKISILVGDYLFSKALVYMMELGDKNINELISRVTVRMSQGELLQMERARDYTMDEATYFRMISDKTASLISTACQIGVLTAATQDHPPQKAMQEFGEYLGLAFQIKDDLLDYMGESQKMGKPTGNDLKENKITLPLLYALNNGHPVQAQKIRKLLQSDDSMTNFEEIRSFVVESGGILYAQQKANELAERARRILSQFEDSRYRTSLTLLTHFAVNRQN